MRRTLDMMSAREVRLEVAVGTDSRLGDGPLLVVAAAAVVDSVAAAAALQ